MAGGVPRIYRKGGGNISPSYDWFDFATGAGYKRFYVCVTRDSVGNKYFLSTKQMHNDHVAPSAGSSTIDYSVVNNTNAELNFDISFLFPVRVKGEVLINYTILYSANSSNYTKFTIYKVVGGVETSIGTIQTSVDTETTSKVHRRLAKLTLADTHFAIGDTLRLEMIMYENGAQNCNWHYDSGTYTESDTAASVGGEITLDIPFRIDL